MSPLNRLQRIAFNASSIAQFLSVTAKAGAIHSEGSTSAFLKGFPLVARYRLSTARDIEQGALVCPDRNALIDDDGVLSYRQLRDQSRIVARWLLARKRDRRLNKLRVAVMARNGRGIIMPMAAKGYTGGELFLLNVGSSPEQISGIFKENGVNVLFIDDEFADRIPADLEGVEVIWAHTTEPHWNEPTLARIATGDDKKNDLPKLPVFPSHGNIVLMSSGTTGVPKGILRPEPLFPLILAGYLGSVPWRIKMTVQITASIFHTWGWSAVNVSLGMRNTIVTQRIFNPENVYRQIQNYSCNGLISSPIFFKQMLDLPDNKKWDTSSLNFIASSGNALTPVLVERMTERFGPILANFYGSTELALAACADAQLLASNPTIAGRIPPGTLLRIYNDRDEEVGSGEVGRIFLTNETALTGYSNPDTPLVKIDGLVEMGDLGYLDNEGLLHVLGRNDDMIIVGGENVHPQSVTEVIERMPGIEEIYSGGVDDDESFKRIAVWVVPKDDEDGAALTAEAIREWVRLNLADHSVPRDVNFVDELPRNATGKVVSRHLPPSTREDER